MSALSPTPLSFSPVRFVLHPFTSTAFLSSHLSSTSVFLVYSLFPRSSCLISMLSYLALFLAIPFSLLPLLFFKHSRLSLVVYLFWRLCDFRFAFLCRQMLLIRLRSDPGRFDQVGSGFRIIVPDPDLDLTFLTLNL
jgi:hypothetical protein